MNPIIIIICLLVVCFVVFFIVYSEEMKSRNKQAKRDKGLVDDPKVLFDDNQTGNRDLGKDSSEDSNRHIDGERMKKDLPVVSNEKYKAHPVNHQLILDKQEKNVEKEESEDIEII